MPKIKRRGAGAFILLAVLALCAALLPGSAAQAAVGRTTVAAETQAVAEVPCNSYTNVYWGAPAFYLHVPSLGANTGDYNCVVVRGMKNIAVLVLQESLKECFKQGIAADSEFGPLTEQAVRNAQGILNRDYGAGLSEDGRFGPKTSSWFLYQIYDHTTGGGAHTKVCDFR